MSGLWVNSDKSCILLLKSWYYIIILDSLILILQLLFLWAVMYARFLLKTSHFGWISDILFPFSRRTHRVRTAKMSWYIKNSSRNSSFRWIREYMWCFRCQHIEVLARWHLDLINKRNIVSNVSIHAIFRVNRIFAQLK